MTTLREIIKKGKKKAKEATKNATNKTLDTELEPLANGLSGFILAILRVILFLTLSLAYFFTGTVLLIYFFKGFEEGNLYLRIIPIIIFILFLRTGYFKRMVNLINKLNK